MPREDAIKVEGTVVAVLPNNLFRVTLANGHRVLAHVAGKMKAQAVGIAPGAIVNLEMTPYDLSKGCIVLREK